MTKRRSQFLHFHLRRDPIHLSQIPSMSTLDQQVHAQNYENPSLL